VLWRELFYPVLLMIAGLERSAAGNEKNALIAAVSVAMD
jgi:hypothetical protein